MGQPLLIDSLLFFSSLFTRHVPRAQVFQLVVQSHIAGMTALNDLSGFDRLKHRAAFFFCVTASDVAALFQIGTKLDEALRQLFLQLQPQFRAIKGTDSFPFSALFYIAA